MYTCTSFSVFIFTIISKLVHVYGFLPFLLNNYASFENSELKISSYFNKMLDISNDQN